MKTKPNPRKIPDEDESDDEEESIVVGQIPTISVRLHIKKRSLKNKALSVSFSDKDLNDFVTGFHKRKKKRRKEAERQLKEKDRLKRVAARKRRKEEKQRALYGGSVEHASGPEFEPDDPGTDGGEQDKLQTAAPVSETKTYESDFTTIIVTTSDLSREDEDLKPIRPTAQQSVLLERNHNLSVKKKPMKSIGRQKPHKKSRKPASSKKDKKKNKGRR